MGKNNIRPAGGNSRLAVAGAIALAIASFGLSLSTIRLGLPGSERLKYLFVSREEHAASVETLAAAREKLYSQIDTGGHFSDAGHFSIPPEEMGVNFTRSFLLQTIWVDEAPVIRAMRNIKPGQFRLNPHFYVYGTPGIYMFGASIKAGQFLGLYPNPSNIIPFLQNPDYSGRLWMMPRLLSALCLSLSILLIFAAVRRIWGDGWGLLAALMMAGSTVPMLETHFLKPYLISMLCGTGVIWLMGLRSGGHRLYAALLAGLATATLIPNGIFAVTVCAAAFADEGKAGWRKPLLYAAISAAVFFALNPWWAYSTGQVLHDLRFASGSLKEANTSMLANLMKLGTAATSGLGLYLFLPAAAGAAAWFFRREYLPGLSVLLLVLLFPYLFASPGMHYAVPVMPAIVILATAGFRELWKLSRTTAKVAIVLAAVAMFAHSTFYIGFLRSSEHSRAEGAQWLADNLKQGTAVASRELVNPVYLIPPFHMLNRKLVIAGGDDKGWMERLKTERPEYYLAAEDSTTELPEFRSMYELAATFGPKPPLNAFFSNHLYRPLNKTFEVYRLKR